MVKKIDKLLDYAILFYLAIPVIIFFIGWLHPIIGITLTVLLSLGIWSYLKSFPSQPINLSSTAKWQLIVVVILTFGWVYLSGIGGFSNQDWDHHYRNAVFNDLIRFDWPVYYQFSPDYDIDFLAGRKAALNYYFAYWLPAAWAGKLFGQYAANVTVLCWTYIGMLLVFFQLFRLIKFKNLLVAAIVFALWSGLDVLGKLIVQRHLVSFNEPIEIYYLFSYTSFTTDLFNVFNQAIPAWLAALWVLTYREKIPVLPIALLFPYGPFPFISLTLFYVIYFLVDTYQTSPKLLIGLLIQKTWARVDILSGLAAVIAIGAPFVAFYKAHAPVDLNQFFGMRLIGQPLSTNLAIIGYYLVTFMLEAGIFFVLIRWIAPAIYQANKLLFWVAFWLLLLIPLWEAGLWRDFASRGSISVLTVLAVIMIQAINEALQQKSYRPALFVVGLVLILSWFTPFWLLRKAPAFGREPRIRDDVVSLARPQVRAKNDKDGVLSSLPYYYSMDPEHKFFYRLLAKRQAP